MKKITALKSAFWPFSINTIRLFLSFKCCDFFHKFSNTRFFENGFYKNPTDSYLQCWNCPKKIYFKNIHYHKLHNTATKTICL